MLLLEERNTTKKHSEICWYESDTKICGELEQLNYFERIESKMIPEPFYGDIDLFGF
ncbi:hypothetical protein UFOVP784_18 [uncultured Caudovirales phage]|jgi:hypothetical protein|uniref:Uncharacterized protein n=1 Tax=uncultured Caudovirales phage TaxID=2100421 RepID=A0A6J5MBV4_9CAUD|nr:hypothetical protein UFOVP436_18 [uncultured Caudovirales phage]CAB4162143.1 hypothetical protein UFOVP784_18 [uncultured Caudovirales phage]